MRGHKQIYLIIHLILKNIKNKYFIIIYFITKDN
jgi:hypothetical protein